MISWILERLTERSTWQGLIAILSAAGIALSPEQAEAFIGAGLAVIGAVGVFTEGN